MEFSKSVFKARDLRCPKAARAVPLVCQNDKVESSRSAEQILGSGKVLLSQNQPLYISTGIIRLVSSVVVNFTISMLLFESQTLNL